MLTAGVIMALAGCATETPAVAGAAPADSGATIHEYRTGTAIASREKHVTTQDERDQVQQIRAAMRSQPGLGTLTGK